MAAHVVGIAVLATGSRMLATADAQPGSDGSEEVAVEVADEVGGAPAAVDSDLQAEHARARA